MKANCKNKSVDVWQVSRDLTTAPDWVQTAFAKNVMVWHGQALKVLMPMVADHPTLGDTHWAAGYFLAEVGDIIDKTRGKIVTENYFAKHYVVEED